MVVTHQRDDAAIRRGAVEIGMAERIAGAVDPRSLAVPDGEDAVVAPLAAQLRLLRTPDGRRRKVLIQARLEHDVVVFQPRAGAPELQVEPAERRAAIA